MLNAFVILILVHQIHCQALSFIPLKTSNGSTLCAVGNVSYTIKTDDIIGVPYVAPGATKCGFFCAGLNSRINCTGFNYFISGLCQFFSTPCITGGSTRGCTYYQDTRLTQSFSCNKTIRAQYTIVSDLNNKTIDISSGGGLIMMPRQTGKMSQLWYFDAQGFLRSAVNDYGVGVTSGVYGTQLFAVAFNGTNSYQQWKWLPGSRWLINYAINLCFAIDDVSPYDGAQVTDWYCNSGKNQVWSLI